jgi:putative NADH-flavin reductase
MRLAVFGATSEVGERLVAEALGQGHEVTVFAHRPPPASHGRLRTLTGAMERCGPRRLVFLSALGVLECRRRATLFSALFLLRFFRVDEVRDAETQERYVRGSSLDWTIVRPGTLSDGPPKGSYRLGFGVADIPADASISYGDTASFMLRQLTRYLRGTVGLFS